LPKRRTDDKDLLRGDKIRDLIFMVYLNNKYGKGKNDISELKGLLGYSTGGIYNALDDSGYFERTPNEIRLTEKGQKYLRSKVLPPYDIIRTIGYCLLFLGFVFAWQWFSWTYLKQYFVVPLYSFLPVIILGVFLTFFVLRSKYYLVKRRRIKLESM
jgi:hypothetical protein